MGKFVDFILKESVGCHFDSQKLYQIESEVPPASSLTELLLLAQRMKMSPDLVLEKRISSFSSLSALFRPKKWSKRE